MSINNLQTPINRRHLKMDTIIKSARLFEKGGTVSIDYRVYPEYKKDGKARTRFSTGIAYGKRTMLRIEREKYQRALEHYLQHTTLVDENTLTVGDIALEALEDGKSYRQEDIHKDYLNIYESFIKPVFEHKVLREIKVLDVKRWKDDLLKKRKLSRGRYLKYHRCLNFIFRFSLENEYIDKNVVALVDKKSNLFAKREKSLDNKYYTATEVDAMLENATGWFRVMLMVYLHTGMRTGEGLVLQWGDIDFEQNLITIQRSMRMGKLKEGTKTNAGRIILMPKPLSEALLEYQKTCTSTVWLFPNPKTGQPYHEAKSFIRWKFKPLLEMLGIEYKTFYSLRHSFASISAQKNIPIGIISKQLGHQNIATTTSFYIKNNLMSDENNLGAFDNLYT